eukprot:1009020-Rhodomonas_salina.1
MGGEAYLDEKKATEQTLKDGAMTCNGDRIFCFQPKLTTCTSDSVPSPGRDHGSQSHDLGSAFVVSAAAYRAQPLLYEGTSELCGKEIKVEKDDVSGQGRRKDEDGADEPPAKCRRLSGEAVERGTLNGERDLPVDSRTLELGLREQNADSRERELPVSRALQVSKAKQQVKSKEKAVEKSTQRTPCSSLLSRCCCKYRDNTVSLLLTTQIKRMSRCPAGIGCFRVE